MPPESERLVRLEQKLEEVLRVLHGPPPLEDRWRAYADGRDEHKERNIQQLVLNIRERLEQDANVIREDLENATEKNDRRHESNDARLSRLEKLAYIAIGSGWVLKLIPSDIIPKLFGGH